MSVRWVQENLRGKRAGESKEMPGGGLPSSLVFMPAREGQTSIWRNDSCGARHHRQDSVCKIPCSCVPPGPCSKALERHSSTWALWAGCSLWAEPSAGWGRGDSSPEDTYSLGQWDEHPGLSYLRVHTVWSTVTSLSGVGPRSARSAKLWGVCKTIRTSVCRPRRGFVWSNFTVLYYVIFTNILDLLSWFYNEKINH